jgi:peptide/nickel transport system ATP-binding protein
MRSPYAEALMSAIPRLHAPPHTRLAAIAGSPPDPTRPVPGCAFSPRCRYARERCRGEAPDLSAEGGDHQYACWFPLPDRAKAPA